jgi:hypothetical protein
MSEPFSLADAEATFGPDDWEQMGDEVAAAPKFRPEQLMALRALFASARTARPTPASEAA